MNSFNADEKAAAAAISGIMNGNFSEKRGRDDDGADSAAGVRPPKMPRAVASRPTAGRELKPAPYFYYRDHSMEADPDPLTPLTPPGRVPNFPAKMHAILSSKDFSDIVAWLPHGRSWRVLKPREFEIKVIPKFFEHAKFSSFVRQANGWGFRRVTTGKDRNSYYHEKFLRGLPHLCKTMKRPGVNEKKQADPDHEPDFYKISEEHPVPEKADDDSVLLNCTMVGGPKARMPIYWGSTMTATTPNFGMVEQAPAMAAPTNNGQMEQKQPTVVSVDMDRKQAASPTLSPMSTGSENNKVIFQMPGFMPVPQMNGNTPGQMTMSFPMPTMPGMDPAAASQFAAGFAAATAFSQQQFSQMFQSMQQQQQQMQQQQGQAQAQPQMQQQVPAQVQYASMPQQTQP